jgi:hypothetical protein
MRNQLPANLIVTGTSLLHSFKLKYFSKTGTYSKSRNIKHDLNLVYKSKDAYYENYYLLKTSNASLAMCDIESNINKLLNVFVNLLR